MLKRTPLVRLSLRAQLRVLALLMLVGWAGLSTHNPPAAGLPALVEGQAFHSRTTGAHHAGLLDDILDLLDDLFGDDDDDTDPPDDDDPLPGSGGGW